MTIRSFGRNVGRRAKANRSYLTPLRRTWLAPSSRARSTASAAVKSRAWRSRPGVIPRSFPIGWAPPSSGSRHPNDKKETKLT